MMRIRVRWPHADTCLYVHSQQERTVIPIKDYVQTKSFPVVNPGMYRIGRGSRLFSSGPFRCASHE